MRPRDLRYRSMSVIESGFTPAAARRLAAIAVAAACSELNARFDSERFFRACGVSDY